MKKSPLTLTLAIAAIALLLSGFSVMKDRQIGRAHV